MIVSLDGYIEGPNRELDWFPENPQFEQYADEMIDSVGIALYGRRAYQAMVGYWPNAEKHPRSAQDLSFAKRMNALPKVVLSRTLKQADWSNTRIVSDNVTEAITELKRQAGKPIVAWAGSSLVATLTQAALVDEYRVIICPTVLGSGTPFFASGITPRLKLVRTTQLGSDVVVLCYEPLRT